MLKIQFEKYVLQHKKFFSKYLHIPKNSINFANIEIKIITT